MWIDGHETQQGSAIGTRKVLQAAAKADHRAAAEGRGAGRVQITSEARLPTTQQNLEMPWYLPWSRQAVRVNH